MSARQSPASSTPERAALAVLGGSSAFTPLLATELARAAAELPPLDVRLHGRSGERLAGVARFCELVADSAGADHRYGWTLSAGEAAGGAQVVLNQVRVGGWAGREHDERFPLARGVPGDETVGPGGLASALRAMPVVLELAREVAAASPGAVFVNLSNPMGILLRGLGRIRGLRTLGLCELPGDTLARALALLPDGGGEGPLEADYLGLNHQGFFTRVARGGRELLPAVFDAVEALGGRGFFRVDAAVMRRLGALPLPYMRLYYHTEREARALATRPRSRGAELAELSGRLHRHWRTAERPELPPAAAERSMPWIADAVVPALVALLGGPPRLLYVSEPCGGDVPGLPTGAVVEKRGLLDAAGFTALPFTGPAPEEGGPHEPIVAFLRRVAAFEEVAAEAALERSLDRRAELVLEALWMHPLELGSETALALAPGVLQAAGEPVA